MIVASGRGYLVPLVWIASSAFFGLVFKLKGFDNFIAAVMVTATVCTLLAKRWKQKSKEAAETSGKPVKYKNHHFFYMPMEYIWVPALSLIVFAFILSAMNGTLHF